MDDFTRFKNVLDKNEKILACQINTHHSMAPMLNLNSWMKKTTKSCPRVVALVQEPYLISNNRKVFCATNSYNLFQGKENCKVRACIFITKNINAWLISQYCNEDITCIGIESENRISASHVLLI